MDLKYFGKKGKKYLYILKKILPISHTDTIIDACMGSGAFSKRLAVPMIGTGLKVIAFELDRSMYDLHMMAVKYPEKLINAIQQKQYTQETFEASVKRCKDAINNKICNSTEDEQLENATAAYCSIYLSFNSMRSSYRSLETYKNETDTQKRKEKKRAQKRIAVAFKKKIASTIWSEHASLKNVDIRNESFMDAPELFECPDNLIYLDVPYPLDQRDSSESTENTDARKTTKKNRQDKLAEDGKAGYLKDWTNKDHDKFLNLVRKAVATGHPAKMIICANFTVDEDGNLKNLAGNTYNKYLLPLGFRLVVVTNTTASVSSKNNAKVPKVEVVWINYKNIVGSWDDLTYFDYKDVYG